MTCMPLPSTLGNKRSKISISNVFYTRSKPQKSSSFQGKVGIFSAHAVSFFGQTIFFHSTLKKKLNTTKDFSNAFGSSSKAGSSSLCIFACILMYVHCIVSPWVIPLRGHSHSSLHNTLLQGLLLMYSFVNRALMPHYISSLLTVFTVPFQTKLLYCHRYIDCKISILSAISSIACWLFSEEGVVLYRQ